MIGVGFIEIKIIVMDIKPTSREAHEYIKPHKQSHQEKILEGLDRLKIGGTHEEIGAVAGLRPDQCWKRLSELAKEGKIFDTMITRKLKSGLQGSVWQLAGKPTVVVSPNPRTMQEFKDAKTLKQLTFLI